MLRTQRNMMDKQFVPLELFSYRLSCKKKAFVLFYSIFKKLLRNTLKLTSSYYFSYPLKESKYLTRKTCSNHEAFIT